MAGPRAGHGTEAADTRVFHSMPGDSEGDLLVWIGNTRAMKVAALAGTLRVLIGRIKSLKQARLHGVRYPSGALTALEGSGHQLWLFYLPNFRSRCLRRARVTVHVPHRRLC